MEKKLKKQRKGSIAAGTWFYVPLPQDHNAIGLAARVNRNRIMLVYFFAGCRGRIPIEADTRHLAPTLSLTQCMTGTVQVEKGRWPVMCVDRQFNSSEWPVPLFGVAGLAKPMATRYSEDIEPLGRVEVSERVYAQLPLDLLSGALGIPTKLCRLLGLPKPELR